uniref:Uncharacterized protein n=1 Tax=Anguilla anguilla TaxID=7936 RepID=A0A0E9XTJ9_ANGAN
MFISDTNSVQLLTTMNILQIFKCCPGKQYVLLEAVGNANIKNESSYITFNLHKKGNKK